MYKIILSFAILLVTTTAILAQNKGEKFEKLDISMFPKAEKGFKQVYIQVPIRANENDYQIELFVGSEQMIDCNSYSMMGDIKTIDLQGWGYNYYNVTSKGEMIGTQMGCMNDTKKKQFVHIAPQTVRYNSKLPIVVYVPKNMEVRYRIWRADATMSKAKVAK